MSSSATRRSRFVGPRRRHRHGARQIVRRAASAAWLRDRARPRQVQAPRRPGRLATVDGDPHAAAPQAARARTALTDSRPTLRGGATIEPMTAPPPPRSRHPPLFAGPRGRRCRRERPRSRRRRERPGCSTAATPSATSSSAGPMPAIANLLWTGEWDPAARCPGGRAGTGADRPPRAGAGCQADGRAAHRGLGVGRDAATLEWPPTGRRMRAGSPPSRRRRWPRMRGIRAGKEPVDARPVAGSRAGLPVPAQRRARGRLRRPGRSTRTSSSAPSTGSTRPPSLRA